MLLLPHKERLEMVIGFMALIFNLFGVAVKIDINMIWHNGKKPVIIGLASAVIPLIIGLIVSYILHSDIRSFAKQKESFIVFIVALYSHTSIPVMSDILSEFGLLSSELGRLALSSSIFQLTSAIPLIGLFGIVDQGQHGGITSILISISLMSLLVAFIIFIIRPYGLWIVQDARSSGCVRYLI
jgi:Kef-type K+ transport system membrane component KefB